MSSDSNDKWKEHISNLIQNSKVKVVDIDLGDKNVKYSNKIKQHRIVNSITGDEELVRVFLINHLVNDLDYKPDLIEIEKEYRIGRPKTTKPRIDLILKDVNDNPFFFIEIKSPSKFERDKEYIEGQLFQLAKFEEEVSYLVYYTLDYKDDHIIDRAIIIDYKKYPKYNEWEKAGFPSISDELSPGYNKPKKPPLTKGDDKYDLRKTINRNEIEGLTKNLHNVLWGGGGTSDTEIFYSLVNIILSKIQDESEKEDGQIYDFQILRYGDTIESKEKVFDRINDLYRRALSEKLNITEKRKLEKSYVINEEKFPLNKLIYTVQTLEDYSFLEGRGSLDGKDILGDFFETITREGFKQTKGQFFTPSKIVKFLIYAIGIDELAIKKLNEDRELPYIIDPSCGSGTFLIEAMKVITKELKYKQKEKISSSRQVEERFYELFMPDSKENHWAREFIYGADINFDLGTSSKVNMILHGDGSANIFVKDGLLPFRFYDKEKTPNYLQMHKIDNLYYEKDVNSGFDVLISNPPFSVDLDTETKRYLNSSFIFGDKKNSENLFIERWYQLLRENGRLGVVLPESVFDTTENTYIRLFLFKYFKIKAVVSLPQLTFEPYTSTKTSLLFAQKKKKSEIEEWNKLWDNFGKEWSLLKTKVENYIKVYLEDKKKSKYPSIKDDNDEDVKKNIYRFIKDYLISSDKELTVRELLGKYKDEIKDLCKYDNSLTDAFGFYNSWWVFGEVSKSVDYPIFMAEAENVGYKRTRRGEKPANNDLFDIELAPSYIDKKSVELLFEEKIRDIERIKGDLEFKFAEKPSKSLETKIDKKEKEIKSLNTEKTETKAILNFYYDDKGFVKEKYIDRIENGLLKPFTEGLTKNFGSDDLLLRKNEKLKILDFLREQVEWE